MNENWEIFDPTAHGQKVAVQIHRHGEPANSKMCTIEDDQHAEVNAALIAAARRHAAGAEALLRSLQDGRHRHGDLDAGRHGRHICGRRRVERGRTRERERVAKLAGEA